MSNDINSTPEQKESILTVSNAKSAAKNTLGLALAVPARVLDSVLFNPLYAGYKAQGLNDISAVQTFNHMSKQKSVVKNAYIGLVGFVQGLIQLPALIVGFLASLLPRAIKRYSGSKPAEQAATKGMMPEEMNTGFTTEDRKGAHGSADLDERTDFEPVDKAASTSTTVEFVTEEVVNAAGSHSEGVVNKSMADDSKVVVEQLVQQNFLYNLFGGNAFVDAIEDKVSPAARPVN